MEQKLITSVETFNTLFSHLSNQPKTVCWMRSIDYKKQLFLSPQFEAIFGGSCDSLCRNPNLWWDYILPNDTKKIKPIVSLRISSPLNAEENSIILFRIHSSEGQIKYIRDVSFTVLNDFHKPIAIAGYGEELSPEFWHQLVDDHTKTPKTSAISNKIDLIKILIDENKALFPILKPRKLKTLVEFTINNIRVKLSQREAQVLEHLRHGKTAKETGNAIFLSQRTVETHLENIKNKTGCKTKLELMSKIAQLEFDE